MYKAFLCLRYLRTRYIALASIISVMLGVATMIVVNSVMAGFRTEMRDRLHGVLADVIIETSSLDGREDAEQHLATVREAAGEYIVGMTETVEVYGMISFQWAGLWITKPVTLIGIKPAGKAQVGPLVDYLTNYQEIREGGELDRPPLRSRDEPPGWELTREAMLRRIRRSNRAPWIDNGDDSHVQPGDDQGPFFNPETEAAAPPGPTVGPENGPVVADGETDPEIANPFDDPGAPKFETEDNPAAPMDGRVYVGIGLLSFQFEDKKTGKIRTVRMVRPGDDVRISTVRASRPPNPVHFLATVVDCFKSGMSEYDSNLVFCNLEYLQKVRGMIDPTSGVRSITSIQIKLKDFDDSDEVVSRLKAAFPPGLYTVKTWEQKQGPLLAAVDIEAAILNVLLFLIIAVAGFGILAIFFMIVVEKTRDIGILKALGASSNGVMSIFLSYGLALGIVGSSVGVMMGLLFVAYINDIESWITWLVGRKVFDERIYYFPEIPTVVNPSMVFWVAAGAMTIAVLASVLPARRAARLHPVEALRYE